MVKNFFEYIKELIPEKGSVFFTHKNHSGNNALSLYQLADLICGQEIVPSMSYNHYTLKEAVAYTWNVEQILEYDYPMIGLMLLRDNGEEKWIHFSKAAFFGAICIVATRNGITFDDEEHESLRQTWARKLEHKETEEDRKITDLENIESNFNEELWFFTSYKWEKHHPEIIHEKSKYPRFSEEWWEEKRLKMEEHRRYHQDRDCLREYYEHNTDTDLIN